VTEQAAKSTLLFGREPVFRTRDNRDSQEVTTYIFLNSGPMSVAIHRGRKWDRPCVGRDSLDRQCNSVESPRSSLAGERFLVVGQCPWLNSHVELSLGIFISVIGGVLNRGGHSRAINK